MVRSDSVPRVLTELATLAGIPAERRRVRRQVYREDLLRRMLVHRVDENLHFESGAKSVFPGKLNKSFLHLSVASAGGQPVSIGRKRGVPHFPGMVLHNLTMVKNDGSRLRDPPPQQSSYGVCTQCHAT